MHAQTKIKFRVCLFIAKGYPNFTQGHFLQEENNLNYANLIFKMKCKATTVLPLEIWFEGFN